MKKFSAANILIILCFVIDCKAEFLYSRLNSCSTPQSNCFYNVKTLFSKGARQEIFCGNQVLMGSNTVLNIDKDNTVIYPEVECCLRPLSAAGMMRLKTKEKWCVVYNIIEYSSCAGFDKVVGSGCDLRLISSFNDAGDCVREVEEKGYLNRSLSGFHNNHRIIINSGILALREKKSIKGRLLPVTQSCDEGLVLVAYAIAIGESSEKQNECCIKLGYEVFGVEEGRTGRRQGGGMCLCQVDMSHSKIVSLSTIGSEKVDAQIEDSNISFLLIHGSKSRRIQIGMEDVKGILAHMGDT